MGILKIKFAIVATAAISTASVAAANHTRAALADADDVIASADSGQGAVEVARAEPLIFTRGLTPAPTTANRPEPKKKPRINPTYMMGAFR